MMLKELKTTAEDIPDLKPHLSQLNKICEEEFKKTEAAIQSGLEKKKADYEANREERDAAAMKIIDTDGSGCLSLDEFMKMMDIESDTHTELMECLGFSLNPGDYIEKFTSEELSRKL